MNLAAELLACTGPVLDLERPPQGGYYDVTILSARQGRFVLKVGRSPGLVAELHDECRVLRDLHAYAPFVPQPVAHVLEGDTGLFLFTCVDGENLLPALERADEAGRHRFMASLGQVLRRIHGWQPPAPRPANWLDQALARAAQNVASGAVPNPIAQHGVFGGRDPASVLADVQGWLRNTELDLVYAHGDFCLPNALADPGAICGVVDWSRGGYADRRVDLAACVGSIRRNLQAEAYVHTFLDAYGYTGTPESLLPFRALEALS